MFDDDGGIRGYLFTICSHSTFPDQRLTPSTWASLNTSCFVGFQPCPEGRYWFSGEKVKRKRTRGKAVTYRMSHYWHAPNKSIGPIRRKLVSHLLSVSDGVRSRNSRFFLSVLAANCCRGASNPVIAGCSLPNIAASLHHFHNPEMPLRTHACRRDYTWISPINSIICYGHSVAIFLCQ